MLKAAINRILELQKPNIFRFEERDYSDKPLTPVRIPGPDPLNVKNLYGIVDFFQTLEVEKRKGLSVHVESHARVLLVSGLEGPFLQRFIYVGAEPDIPYFPFGKFIELEEFIIALRTRFLETDTLPSLLKIIGNISDGTIKTRVDDGISQKITTKTGVATVEEVEVPNPVTLRPYRTFLEIEQPESPFLLRLRGDGKAITAALFEADGGKWKIDAIRGLKDWFIVNLPEIPVIA